MIFDDNFYKLTGSQNIDGSEVKKEDSDRKNQDDDITSDGGGFLYDNSSSRGGTPWSSDLGNPDYDYVIESDLVTPKVETVKSEKKLIVVVDDDFETLDLLEIFLKRDYEYAAFSGPREAIFYLNQHMPDLILIDCKIHTIKAKTFVEIIRTSDEKKGIPFIYLGNQEELDSIRYEEMPEGVIGYLKRPVSRGDLQKILDDTVNKI